MVVGSGSGGVYNRQTDTTDTLYTESQLPSTRSPNTTQNISRPLESYNQNIQYNEVKHYFIYRVTIEINNLHMIYQEDLHIIADTIQYTVV